MDVDMDIDMDMLRQEESRSAQWATQGVTVKN